MHSAFNAVLAISTVIGIDTAASAASMSLNPSEFTSSLRSITNDGQFPEMGKVAFPASMPFSDGHIVVDGGSISSSSYELTDTVLDIRFDHGRQATEFAFAMSQGSLYFTVDTNVGYILEGSYVANDPDGLTVYQRAYLYDDTTRLFLFHGLQHSEGTPNESFLLGLAEGSLSNSVVGSLTGTLIPGHVYEFYYRSYILSLPTPIGSPASASGSVRLLIIPEPASALLLASGLVGLAVARRALGSVPTSRSQCEQSS